MLTGGTGGAGRKPFTAITCMLKGGRGIGDRLVVALTLSASPETWKVSCNHRPIIGVELVGVSRSLKSWRFRSLLLTQA